MNAASSGSTRGAGHYEQKLLTKAGEVALKVPRLRSLPLETQIIERYRRRESSIEEAMMEMYLAGVSVRQGGGHHRGAVGGAREPEHGRRPEPEVLEPSTPGETGPSRASTPTCFSTGFG